MLAEFNNDDTAMRSSVHKHVKGYSVSLQDLDSGEYVPIVRIFPEHMYERAIAYTKEIAA